jgi:hypothetical protein
MAEYDDRDRAELVSVTLHEATLTNFLLWRDGYGNEYATTSPPSPGFPERIHCIQPHATAADRTKFEQPTNPLADRIAEYIAQEWDRPSMFDAVKIAAEKLLTSRADPAILHSEANEGSPDVERGRTMEDVNPHEVVRAKIEADAAFEVWQSAIVASGDTEAAFAAWREATAKFVSLMMTQTVEFDEIFNLLVSQEWADQRNKGRGE